MFLYHDHHIEPQAMQRLFRLYAPAGVTPHKIRHSFASEFYKASHDLRILLQEETLGHAINSDHANICPHRQGETEKSVSILSSRFWDVRRRKQNDYYEVLNGYFRPSPMVATLLILAFFVLSFVRRPAGTGTALPTEAKIGHSAGSSDGEDVV